MRRHPEDTRQTIMTGVLIYKLCWSTHQKSCSTWRCKTMHHCQTAVIWIPKATQKFNHQQVSKTKPDTSWCSASDDKEGNLTSGSCHQESMVFQLNRSNMETTSCNKQFTDLYSKFGTMGQCLMTDNQTFSAPYRRKEISISAAITEVPHYWLHNQEQNILCYLCRPNSPTQPEHLRPIPKRLQHQADQIFSLQ